MYQFTYLTGALISTPPASKPGGLIPQTSPLPDRYHPYPLRRLKCSNSHQHYQYLALSTEQQTAPCQLYCDTTCQPARPARAENPILPCALCVCCGSDIDHLQHAVQLTSAALNTPLEGIRTGSVEDRQRRSQGAHHFYRIQNHPQSSITDYIGTLPKNMRTSRNSQQTTSDLQRQETETELSHFIKLHWSVLLAQRPSPNSLSTTTCRKRLVLSQ